MFRLWLENLNWVPNAETASGPTPSDPPEFAEFLAGVAALQRLTDRKLATIFIEEKDDPVGDDVPGRQGHGRRRWPGRRRTGSSSARPETGNWRIVRKKQQPTLRLDEAATGRPGLPDALPGLPPRPGRGPRSTSPTAKLDPYLKDAPKDGLDKLDLETRSLLQVLFFVSHGVEVPPEHVQSGVAPQTLEPDGRVFDWQQVLGGLFKVCSAAGKKPPPCARRRGLLPAATGSTSTTGTGTRRRRSPCCWSCRGCNSRGTRAGRPGPHAPDRGAVTVEACSQVSARPSRGVQ